MDKGFVVFIFGQKVRFKGDSNRMMLKILGQKFLIVTKIMVNLVNLKNFVR